MAVSYLEYDLQGVTIVVMRVNVPCVIMCCTCLIGESEDDAAIRDAAHISDGGDAAVVGVVLRTQVLQLQYLRFPLQLRPNRHRYANVCKISMYSR